MWATRGPDYSAELGERRRLPAPRSAIDPEYLAHHAILAANGHNTQPWRFEFSGSQVVIAPDMTRSTPVVDPDNHHLYASLGCAAENLMLAAAAAGSASATVFRPSADSAVVIDLVPAPVVSSPLHAAIAARQSTRADFDGRPLTPGQLSLLERAAEVEGCRAVIVADRPKMESVLELIVAANTAQVGNPAFVRELLDWMRFNASSAVAQGDGLYSACSGNPTLPTWLGNMVFPRVFTAKSENAKCVTQVRSSSGLAVIVSDRNDPMHWVQAGRSAQRFALKATALGLKVSFLNQPVEESDYRPRLAALLGLGDRRPDLVMRFGHGPSLPKSMRRPLADVMRVVAA